MDLNTTHCVATRTEISLPAEPATNNSHRYDPLFHRRLLDCNYKTCRDLHQFIKAGIASQMFTDHISSPLLAESLAIRASLLHASSLGITKIRIQSDFQELVRTINEK
ncbi:Ribonuclease H domain-containing protein [Hirschfeldia incana]|nr:Ribonuclease H domain-containing protein [Hirschfeldia incana]